MNTFYGGVTPNGKKVTLVIDGKNWYWPKSKHLTELFCHLPVGTKFSIESVLNEKTITVKWDTLVIHEEYMDDVVIKDYILDDACARKNRTLKSAKNKLDGENLRKMTLSQLNSCMLTMSNAQQQATLAVVISELMRGF